MQHYSNIVLDDYDPTIYNGSTELCKLHFLTLSAAFCSLGIELSSWEGGRDWLDAVVASVNGRETVPAAAGASFYHG